MKKKLNTNLKTEIVVADVLKINCNLAKKEILSKILLGELKKKLEWNFDRKEYCKICEPCF